MTENHLIQKSVFLKLFSYFYLKIELDDLILSVKTLFNAFFEKNIYYLCFQGKKDKNVEI